jgi:hypothetical protein
MKCNRVTQFSKTPKWAAAWHRQRCAECRAAARADKIIESGVAMLANEPLPAEGLASTLAALPELSPVGRPAPAARWIPRLAAAGGACAAVAVMAGYVLNGGTPPVRPSKQMHAAQDGGQDNPAKPGVADPSEKNLSVRPPVPAKKFAPAVIARSPAETQGDERARVPRSGNTHRHVNKRPSEPTAVAGLPKALDTALGYEEKSPALKPGPTEPNSLVRGHADLRPTPEAVADKHVTVLASYGVDGDRQVKMAAARRYVIREQAAEAQATPQHLYVIDRLSVTPREPQVASVPGRAKESQVW